MPRRRERGITRPGEPARVPAKGRICGQEAGPQWCDEPCFSRGLCRRHYRRAAKGLPLDPDDGHQVGVTPSGHGIWGVVDEDAGGRLVCHDCGRAYLALGVHIGMTHGSVRDYRLRHGLTMSTSLAAEPLRRRYAETARIDGLIEARRPEHLAAADPEIIARGIRLRRRP